MSAIWDSLIEGRVMRAFVVTDEGLTTLLTTVMPHLKLKCIGRSGSGSTRLEQRIISRISMAAPFCRKCPSRVAMAVTIVGHWSGLALSGRALCPIASRRAAPPVLGYSSECQPLCLGPEG